MTVYTTNGVVRWHQSNAQRKLILPNIASDLLAALMLAGADRLTLAPRQFFLTKYEASFSHHSKARQLTRCTLPAIAYASCDA